MNGVFLMKKTNEELLVQEVMDFFAHADKKDQSNINMFILSFSLHGTEGEHIRELLSDPLKKAYSASP